jgi:hypothetical protein
MEQTKDIQIGTQFEVILNRGKWRMVSVQCKKYGTLATQSRLCRKTKA